MRIGIEGLPLLFHRTGTSTYTHELVQHLRKLPGDAVILFGRDQRGAGGSYHQISYPQRAANLFYREYLLPRELAQQHIDVYHSPRDMGLPAPERLPCPCVMTLHDIILVRLARDYYSASRARLYARRLRSRVLAADRLITVSEFSRQEIVEWAGIDPARVSVVYNGVSEKFRPVTDEELLEDVRRRYDLPRRYLLCVGSTEPRKNVAGAIRAFAGLRGMEPDIGMVVTGVAYCGVEPQRAFAGLPLEGVTFAGYINDADMPAILSAAELLFFPSLYEGFGLPPLEAMACGTPVVTSNTTAIPEIVAGAAVLVNPVNTAELAGALQMVLNSGRLRSELIEKGFGQAARFSWIQTALETRKIYEKAVHA